MFLHGGHPAIYTLVIFLCVLSCVFSILCISATIYTSAIHTVFKATVVAKLSYASPAWWGFTSTDDRNRLEAFLRRSVRLGYRHPSDLTFSIICEQFDETFFNSIKHNANHLLYPLLPQERSQHYSLRQRPHNFQIPMRTSALNNNNFMNRILFRRLSIVSICCNSNFQFTYLKLISSLVFIPTLHRLFYSIACIVLYSILICMCVKLAAVCLLSY